MKKVIAIASVFAIAVIAAILLTHKPKQQEPAIETEEASTVIETQEVTKPEAETTAPEETTLAEEAVELPEPAFEASKIENYDDAYDLVGVRLKEMFGDKYITGHFTKVGLEREVGLTIKHTKNIYHASASDGSAFFSLYVPTETGKEVIMEELNAYKETLMGKKNNSVKVNYEDCLIGCFGDTVYFIAFKSQEENISVLNMLYEELS